MKEFAKGCLFFMVAGLLLLLGLKFILGGDTFDMLMFPLILFSPILLMIFLATASSFGEELIKAGKWIGLGSILGNVANNKINADASKKEFKKKIIRTGNSSIDNFMEFVSPSSSSNEDGPDVDLKEYQEFLKWKKEKDLPTIDEEK